MIKTTAKIAFLLAVLTVFVGSSAYASTTGTFRLRVEDLTTGAGIVVSSTNATLNQGFCSDPNPANCAAGTSNAGDLIYTSQSFEDFVVHVSAAYTEGGTASTGPGVLTVSATISTVNNCGTLNSCSTAVLNNPATIRLTLEDADYAYPTGTTATFTGTLQGSSADDDPYNPTQYAQLSGGAVSGSFQTWVNTANQAADFGCDGVYDGTTVNCGSTSLNPPSVVIPTGTLFTLPGGDAGQSFAGPSALIADSVSGDVAFGASYAIMSQATLYFAAPSTQTGSASFTLQGQVSSGTTGTPLTSTSVPEPTSLVLLGSGLVGLGVLRRQYGRKV